jgi:hypothetical protein
MILSSLALMTVLTAGVIVLSCPYAFSSSLIEICLSPQPLLVEEGSLFSVWINISNVESPGIYGYQLTLYYDPNLLRATSASIPEHHFLTPSSPSNVFIIDGGTIDNEQGKVSFAVSLLLSEEGKTGSGALASVEFMAVSQGNFSLTFGDVILVDPECNEIPSSQIMLEHGSVDVGEGTPAPLSSPFKVYISPQSSSVNVGQKLSIGIYIVKAPLPGIFAYRLSLSFNRTMLEAVAAGIPEGSFLDTSAPETFSIMHNGTIDKISGLVLFEATRLAPEQGRTGNGLLAFAEFLANAPGNCSLTIDDMTITDQDGNPFPSSQYERVPATVVVITPSTPPEINRPEIYMNTYVNHTWSGSMDVNDTFQINVFITYVSSPGLFSYQFTLRYDCVLVEAVTPSIPEGHFLTPSSPENLIIIDNGTIDKEAGNVSFAAKLLTPEEGKTGNGLLATVQFKTLASGDATFRLEDVVLVTPDAQILNYDMMPSTIAIGHPIVPEFESVAMVQILLLSATLVIVITRRRKLRRFI